RYRDQEIAGSAAGAGQPLPLQPDGLPVVEAGRDLHVHLLAGRKLDAFLRAFCRLRQGDGQRGGDVLGRAAEIPLLELEAAARASAARGAAERFLEDVLETAEAAKSAAGAAAPALKAGAPPSESLENAVLAEARARTAPGAEAFEALEARLALGIDLAAIERLALALLAQDLVGRVQLGKARRRLGV